jgi:serine/threonine-protein kinase HipA
LAWPILGVRHFSSISRSVLLEAGAALSLAKGTADRVLESLRGRVAAEAQALCAEVEAENAEIVGVRPELAATMAGEIHCVRAMVHTVLKEMAKQIA